MKSPSSHLTTKSSTADLTGVSVKGITSWNRKASRLLKTLALIFDTWAILSLSLILLPRLGILPFPRFSLAALLSSTLVAYWVFQKAIFRITLGQRIWHIKLREVPPQVLKKKSSIWPNLNDFYEHLSPPLFQRDHLTAWDLSASILATLLLSGIAFYFGQNQIFQNPLWIQVTQWNLEAAVPELQDPESSGMVIPFFYQIGSWPVSFQNQPLFYTLQYEIGPPQKFIGKITLNFQSPEIQLTLEGPKTPENAGTQKEIKTCLVDNRHDSSCTTKRFNTLSRHLDEIQNAQPLAWSLQWFQVHNSSLAPEDEAQGIHLRSTGAKNHLWIQDRFILVNAGGVHQSLILDRPDSPQGELAYAALLKTIRSLRSFTDLDAGRAWINRALETIQLENLESIKDAREFKLKASQIQSLLISKISVDPASYDSYFHLAGISFLLGTHPPVENEIRAPNSPLRLSVVKNLQTASRFAQDILPRDPRNHQIDQMNLKLKNYLASHAP